MTWTQPDLLGIEQAGPRAKRLTLACRQILSALRLYGPTTVKKLAAKTRLSEGAVRYRLRSAGAVITEAVEDRQHLWIAPPGVGQ